MLHGHQKKVLAKFVLGAMKAESIVVQRVAEERVTENVQAGRKGSALHLRPRGPKFPRRCQPSNV